MNNHSLILIVEDSKSQALMLENILQRANYQVAVAYNGREALEWLANNKPIMVISDIMMPEINGFELCTIIKTKEETNNIPVILLTSLSGTEEVVQGLNAGADSFLTKPYEESYLLSHIQKVLADQVIQLKESKSFGSEIIINGKKQLIKTDEQHVIQLLVNIYEGSIQRNTKLIEAQNDLKRVNENLEELVSERTKVLNQEIEVRKQIQDQLNQKTKEIEAQNEEYKKTNEELVIAVEKAAESDRLKSAFLSNMSHEIRTPMSGILGFTSLLKDQDFSEDEREKFIEIIEKSGERMLNTINDIIDISKIEAGQVQVSSSYTNIDELLESLFSFFNLEAHNKGLNLTLNKSLCREKVVIKTDKEKLNSVLTNLIKNAIKYSKVGTVEFGYSIKTQEKNTVLEFYVKDNGIGIPKNRHEAIFDRFVQADITDRAAFEGNGLGLSICKAYLEMLGGEIWVESEEGKGSRFYFTIPYAIPESSSPEKINPLKSHNKNKWKKELKILIAEDDEFSMIHLNEILKPIGKEILTATNGQKTIELCREHKDIELILMDIKMPKKNGFEALKEIRTFNKDVIIIAQTAYALEDDMGKAMNSGFNDYISKPINKDELLKKVEKFFQISH